jgi:adenylate cyclase class IV
MLFESHEGLGHFLELEAVVSEEVGLNYCQARIEELLSRFKVQESDLVANSYYDLRELVRAPVQAGHPIRCKLDTAAPS